MLTWKQILVAAGAGIASGALLYYLLRDDDNDSKDIKKGISQPIDMSKITKAQVMEILREILKSQEKMKDIMKMLTAEIIEHSYDFQTTYTRVKEVQPVDPLDKYGLSMTDFDSLLENFQSDAAIREIIVKIMGQPNASSVLGANSSKIKKQTIIKVHEYMQQELKKVVDSFSKLPNKHEYDMKIVTISSQAMVGAQVQIKFNLSSEDIEAAVIKHHQELSTDPEFARINVTIQGIMNNLMGSQFPF